MYPRIFYELPVGTHQDVLPQRRSHMDLVVEGRTYDEYKMGAEEEGEKKGTGTSTHILEDTE
jgi:hypothetical protein